MAPIMMSMHTIRVVYDPTTRRISLAQNSGNYGGATTDINSVTIIVTGIVPDGTNFKARIDFGVQARTATHVYNHPFVLLEQDADEWSCVIPNPILRAAGLARCRLPIQLVIANDDYVINSRNTITLEVTQAIDGEDDGSEIPPYDVPEWVIPEGQTVYEEDVHLVEVEYTPATRTLTVSNEGSRYGGSTIDCQSVAIQVTGIVPVGNDFSIRADFAVPVEVEKSVFVRPFVVMEPIGNAWRCMIPQAILMAAKELKKLPFQLVMRHGDVIINSRNTITLDITRAINAMESIAQTYAPYIMLRDDSWGWLEDFTYKEGAVVTYEGQIYVSLIDDNLGLDPAENPEAWGVTGIDSVSLAGVEGTRVGDSIVFTEEQIDSLIEPPLVERVPAPLPAPSLENDGKAIISDGSGYVFGEARKVDDVLVNGTSVVSNKIASVTVPTAVSQLTNDAGYVSDISGKANTNLDNISGLDTGNAGKAILVSSTGGIEFGEAGKVDQIQINGTPIAGEGTQTKIANIPVAASDSLGVVKIGSNINISGGAISVPTATSAVPGVVQLVTAENLNPGDTSITVPTEAKMEQFVNSSIATNTAYFLGSYDVESLGLTDSATHEQVVAALNAKTTWVGGRTPSNNDYCFVYFDLSQDPGNVDRYERYKYDGSTWGYEYTLNNSSFTQAQWAAINSLISNSGNTGIDVQDILSHISNTSIHIPVSELVRDVKVGTESVVNNVRTAVIPIAGTNKLGAVKTGYTSSGKDYAVEADEYGNLHVDVPWLDRTVDSVNHHYLPSAVEGYKISVSASGGVASWNTDVLSGFTVSRDAAGHVTAITPISVAIPPNPDTHWHAHLIVNTTPSSTTSSESPIGNGDLYLNLVENNSVRNTYNIFGEGLVEVTRDSQEITITDRFSVTNTDLIEEG